MDLAAFIHQYGYIAILIGCMIEGETVAVLGGIATDQGLNLFNVYLMAFTGVWLCDSILFLIGHYYGPTILKRLTKYQTRIDKIERMIQHHDILAIIGLRFLYGLRTIGPVAIGIAGINPIRFIICNAFGSALWSLIFVTLGYTVGRVFQEQLQQITHHLIPVLVFVIILFSLFLAIKLLISRRSKNKHPQP